MRQLTHDLFTVDHYEQKTNDVTLYDIDHFIHLKEKYKDLVYDMDLIPYSRNTGFNSKVVDIEKYLNNNYPFILEILEIGQNQISLCGGSITSIMTNESINDFDFFFHCESED